MVDRDVSFGPITVRFGNVATWCGRMIQPASGAGVQILSYTFSVAGTGWSQVNPSLMTLDQDGSGLVPVGTWLQENDSLVTMLQRTVPEPIDAGSSNHDALAVNVVPYALNPADEGNMVAPCAIGSPSNPTILAHRSSPLWFNTAAVAAMPSVIDLDVLTPIAGWPSWANSRPTMAEVLPRWAGYCGELWAGSWGFASRLPSAHHSRGGYGHYYSGKVSDGMLMALSTEGTAADRKELARRITQWGVDLYGAFVLGRNDGVDGGHYQGRQGLIVWAGHFLEKSWVDCVPLFPGQLHEAEQYYTTSPKAWSFTDRNWTAGYKGKSESPTNLLLPVDQWGTHFETMLYLTGYFQPAVGSQVGTALAMQILGRTAEMGAGHRGMVAQFMEGPGTANLEAIDDIVITCIDPRDGQVFDSGHPRDILWGYSDSPDGHNGFGRAAWIAYSSYVPPATTVERDPGPGTSTYASARYDAQVDGEACYVWSHTRTTIIQTDVASPGDTIEAAFAKFGADGPTTVSIGLISGTVTAVEVYPQGVVTATVSGGRAVLSGVPVGAQLRVEINNDRRNPMHVFAQPLKPALPVSRTDWTSIPAKNVASIDAPTNVVTMAAEHGWTAGQQVIMATSGVLPAVAGDPLTVHTPLYVLAPGPTTMQLARSPGGAAIDFTGTGTGTHTLKAASWSNSSSALYFPAGVHVVGRIFGLGSGVTVYVDRGAIVIGGWSLIGTDNVRLTVPGVLGGMFATSEEVAAISDFNERIRYSMFLGYDGVKFSFANDIELATVLGQPFFCSFLGLNTWTDVAILSPWYWELNGPDFAVRQFGVDHTASATRVFAWCGDDTFTIGESVSYCDLTIDQCFAVTMANSCYHLGYWSQPPTGFPTRIQNSHAMHLGIVDTNADGLFPVRGGNTIFKGWSDGFVGEENFGRFLVTIDELDVWGPIRSRVWHLGNRLYPFGIFDRARKGQIANWTISGLRVHQTPGQVSIIESLDASNTPHHIAITDSSIGGTPLTAGNWTTFVQMSPDAYQITVNGVRVDRIDTTGFAVVQLGAAGTSGLVVGTSGIATVAVGAAGSSGLLIAASGQATVWVRAGGNSELGAVVPETPAVPMNAPRGPGVAPGRRLRRRGWWTWLQPWA